MSASVRQMAQGTADSGYCELRFVCSYFCAPVKDLGVLPGNGTARLSCLKSPVETGHPHVNVAFCDSQLGDTSPALLTSENARL